MDRAGYVRFRHWRVYGERGLAGDAAVVWLYGETLTVSFADEPLAQYTARYQPNRRHLASVTELERFETPYQSPQPPLWNLAADDWLTVVKLAPYAPRRRRSDGGDALQPRLFADELVDEAS